MITSCWQIANNNMCPRSATTSGIRIRMLAVSILLSVTPGAFSVGFRLPNQDPEGIARGNAFVATADNPSAIYYNPAGITQLEGHNFSAGIYLISADTEYKSASGAKGETDSHFQPVPQLHYVFSPKDSTLSFGLGIYAPYGLSLDWGKNSPFTTLAENGQILYATINPIVAWQIHPTLSVGIGPTINYSEAEFERAIAGFPGSEFRFEGDGIDYGFTAGIRWQPHDQWAFGVKYHHVTEVEYEGTSATTPSPPMPAATSTKGSVLYPRFVVGGVSYRPTEDWNLEFNVDWTDWDNVDGIVFQGTAFGNIPFTLNYTSSLMYEFGITRKLCSKYYVSVGYLFSENSIPDRNFNPIVPDSDLHLGSIGFSRRGERWSCAIGYHFALGNRRVANSVSDLPTTETADGKYDTLNHAINISTTLKF